HKQPAPWRRPERDGFPRCRESPRPRKAGSSDDLGHALRRSPTRLATALKLPERRFTIHSVRLGVHLQSALSEAENQLEALLQREVLHLLAKLVSQVVGYGSHGPKYSPASARHSRSGAFSRRRRALAGSSPLRPRRESRRVGSG